MSQLWIFVVVGLSAGGAYALTAIGVVTVYRGSGVLNFAHGAIGMAGTYVFWMCFDEGLATHPSGAKVSALATLPVGPAIAVGIAAGAVLGLAVYGLVMYPLRNASELARVIATLGVLLVVQNLALLVYSSDTAVSTRFLGRGRIDVFGAPLRYDSAVVCVVTVLLACLLSLLFRRTRLGLAATALQVRPVAASTLGISPHPTGVITWALGGALASAAGILVVPQIGLSPVQLTLLINYAFAASLLGRFRNYAITVVAGFAMGIAESVMTLYDIDTWIKLSTPFAVILVALVAGGTAVPGRGFAESRMPRVGDGLLRPLRIAIGFGLATFLALTLSSGWAISIANAAIAAIVSLSIVIVTGYAGQISLAPFAIMGLSALLSAHAAGTWGLGTEAGMLVGVAAGAGVGFLVGLPAVRVRGMDLTVATFGFGIVVSNAVLTWPGFIGGSGVGFDGVVVPKPDLLGIDVDPASQPHRFVMLCLLLMSGVAVGVANLRRSRGGRRLLAVRANERGAAAIGISVGGAKVAAFTMGGAVIGLAGALMTFRTRSVTFTDYDVFRSIYALAFTIVGGVAYVLGALHTGFITTGGPIAYLFRNASGNLDQILAILSGLLVIQIMLQHPDGIIALLEHHRDDVRRRLRRHRARSSEPPVAIQASSHDIKPVAAAGVPQLQIDRVTLDHGAVRAVDAVSLDVPAGRIVGVIGPNGAGKTSLIDAVTGFVPVASGRILLGDDDITGRSIRRRARAGLGRTFQNLELFSDLTVRENLLAASDSRDLRAFATAWIAPGSQELDGAGREAAVLLGLSTILERRISDLPQGTQRLVTIARALAARPKVVCLDEPAAGLAEHERDAMSEAIRLLVRTLNIGVLLVEHNIDVVAGLCDHVVVLDFGAVIASGPPDDVLTSPLVRDAYLGTAGDLVAAPARLAATAATAR